MLVLEDVVKNAVGKYGREREALLSILQDIAQQTRELNEDILMLVAEELNMSAAEVYGVATFYSFLGTQPRGKYVIRICKTIMCDIKGKDGIIIAIEDRLGIRLGQTTPDNKFTFLTTNCVGWCHKGPAMLINDDVYTELTPDRAVSIIEAYMERGD